MKRISLKTFLFVCFLIGLGVGCFIVFKPVQYTFPMLPSGSYLGSLQLDQGTVGVKRLPIYVEQSKEKKMIMLTILDSEWESKIHHFKPGEEKSLLPIKLTSPREEWILIGSEKDIFSGDILSKEGQRAGRWQFNPLAEPPVAQSPAEVEPVRAFVSAKAQIEALDQRAKVSEMTVAQQKTEFSKLTHFITEGESLKRNANNRYETAKSELDKVKKIAQTKRAEAKALSDKLLLSQRFTEMGKLVSLARESIDRENRWTDSIIKSSIAVNNPDLEAAVQKAERIAALKNELARYRIGNTSGSIVIKNGNSRAPAMRENNGQSNEISIHDYE